MTVKAEKTADVFQRAGRRSTAQRRLILEVLAQEGGHLDAEAVHARVRALEPRVGLATVYRSLAILEDLGLVVRNSLGEEHGHFEAAGAGPHHHFTCRGCGAVIEFRAPEAERAARRVGARQGILVTDVSFELTGYCARCRKRAPRAGRRSER